MSACWLIWACKPLIFAFRASWADPNNFAWVVARLVSLDSSFMDCTAFFISCWKLLLSDVTRTLVFAIVLASLLLWPVVKLPPQML